MHMFYLCSSLLRWKCAKTSHTHIKHMCNKIFMYYRLLALHESCVASHCRTTGWTHYTDYIYSYFSSLREKPSLSWERQQFCYSIADRLLVLVALQIPFDPKYISPSTGFDPSSLFLVLYSLFFVPLYLVFRILVFWDFILHIFWETP